ncbi:gliding motility lipoprotein GldH [Lewinella sp. IMCC34183]|uniref:gliding motility lipoprotein GldH n=1 Tax=Lewinella sp. IMCC34183 TaxID=2248762 RepID=UPI0013005964|nr:gliding motility lipoprotein GldH [Lewinella sp. IMCC34183]
MSLRVVTCLVLPLLLGCGPDVAYEETVDLGPDGWAYADSVSFDFPVSDTARAYDLVLSVTHGTDFPFQNFYVDLSTHLPDATVLRQPLSLQLADTFGEWYGDCSGERCTTDIALQEGTHFTEVGPHRLVVTQFSRRDTLPEVSSLGFRIVAVPESGE